MSSLDEIELITRQATSTKKEINALVNQIFERDHKDRKVLLTGGQSGLCIGWHFYDAYWVHKAPAKDFYNSKNELIKIFIIRVKQTEYKVKSEHIIGWEKIAKTK